jgi:hypothetical protein
MYTDGHTSSAFVYIYSTQPLVTQGTKSNRGNISSHSSHKCMYVCMYVCTYVFTQSVCYLCPTPSTLPQISPDTFQQYQPPV